MFGGSGLVRIKKAIIGVMVAGSLAIPLLLGTNANASAQSISPQTDQSIGALLLTPHVAGPETVSWHSSHYSHSSHSSHASHYSHYSSRW